MTKLQIKRLDCIAALGMFVYASSVVATPIILLKLADELTFSLAGGGGIEAVRAGFLLAVLIFSGAAAAHLGKIRTLTAGSFVLGGGLFIYSIAPAYWVVLLAVVLVGIGGGVLEALLNPLVQEEHPEDSGRYLNIVNAFFSVGVMSSVLLLGELLTRGVSWRILVAGIGLAAICCGVLFFVSSDAKRHRDSEWQKKKATQARPGTWRHAEGILRERNFWLFAVAMFCGGGAEGAFIFWSASYIQLNFGTLARAGAFGTAAFAAGMAVGRFATGHFVRQANLHRLIIISACVGIAASIAAWAVHSTGAFSAVVFAAGLSIACFWPSIQSHAAACIPLDATMLFILLSCAGIPGFGLTSWIMGIIAASHGLRASLLVIPALLLLLTLSMIILPRQAD